VYKFLINALSIATPALSSSNSPTAFDGNGGAKVQIPITTVVVQNDRKTQLQLSARAQLVLPRKQTRRWHAALAGAIAGGLAIIWEKRTRRSLIAQQLFVRFVVSNLTYFILDGRKAACKGLITRTQHVREFTSLMETLLYLH